MDDRDTFLQAVLAAPASGERRHRFMESSDINAAFRALHAPLRANIGRGMTVEGQLYAIEMDGCIPGELLAIEWIPPATRGIADPACLDDAVLRRRLVEQLLGEARPESLIAYLGERPLCDGDGSELHVEITSADACWAAHYPVRQGRRRELGRALPRRVDRD